MHSRQPALRFEIDQRQLADFCARHRVRTLHIFGSALRDDFSSLSDIDVLVEFEPGFDPDLFELGGMQQDLSDLLGRDVDLRTREMFSPGNLQRVLASSIVGYAA